MPDPVRFRLLADYGCHPLWWDGQDGRFGDVDPAEFGLTPRLVAALSAWAGRFDATLVSGDPARSGFVSPAAQQAFEQEGSRLAALLATELGPSATIRYAVPPGGWAARQLSPSED